MTLTEILGRTEDASIVNAASAERIARTRGDGRARTSVQSGESRAWGMSGDVD
jgi:hypothetical protein